MELLLSFILGLATLAFVFSPLLEREEAYGPERAGTGERWVSLAQLELDQALGKIDEAEFEELRRRAATEPILLSPLEASILVYRRVRRFDRALETEVLIARARKRKRQERGQG